MNPKDDNRVAVAVVGIFYLTSAVAVAIVAVDVTASIAAVVAADVTASIIVAVIALPSSTADRNYYHRNHHYPYEK